MDEGGVLPEDLDLGDGRAEVSASQGLDQGLDGRLSVGLGSV